MHVASPSTVRVKKKKPGNSESQGGGGLKLLPGAIQLSNCQESDRRRPCRRARSRTAFWVNKVTEDLQHASCVLCVDAGGEPPHVQRGGKV